jgi:hypothetical protein
MKHLFTLFAKSSINSDTKSRCLLTYLRLVNSNKRGGRFNESDYSVAGVQKRTFCKHIEQMLSFGWIEILENKTYRLKSQLKLIGKKKHYAYCMSAGFLDTFSHKKIASFRAFISEIVLSYEKKVVQNSVIKGFKAKYNINGVTHKVTVKDASLSQTYDLAAATWAKFHLGKSVSTVLSYRKLQNLALYRHDKVKVSETYYRHLDSCSLGQLNEYNGKRGRFYFGRDGLMFNSVSIRTSFFEIVKVC